MEISNAHEPARRSQEILARVPVGARPKSRKQGLGLLDKRAWSSREGKLGHELVALREQSAGALPILGASASALWRGHAAFGHVRSLKVARVDT
jgi:hypothetical protein